MSRSVEANFNLMGLFWIILFVGLGLTGNCETCGLDKDYIEQWSK